MPPKKEAERNLEDLLTKLLAVSLWSTGATQDVIAARLGKGKAWVNAFLKSVPRPSVAKAGK
jgi:hypothetical protein